MQGQGGNDTTTGLAIKPHQTLALLGGDLTLEGGTLKTAEGQIELGSVGNQSLVNLIPTNILVLWKQQALPPMVSVPLA